MSYPKEVKAFRKLLNEFADYHPLVNYTHRILCETHKNTHVKLGQPPNIKREDGTELGPCGNDGFVEIKGCISFPLRLEVGNIKETLDKLWSPNKIRRK